MSSVTANWYFSPTQTASLSIFTVEGPSKKDIMELTGRTENNRIVNFQGSPDMIGKFVDIKITDVYTNSLRGEVVRTEDQMGLRIAQSPQEVMNRTRKEDELGVGRYHG